MKVKILRNYANDIGHLSPVILGFLGASREARVGLSAAIFSREAREKDFRFYPSRKQPGGVWAFLYPGLKPGATDMSPLWGETPSQNVLLAFAKRFTKRGMEDGVSPPHGGNRRLGA